MNPRNSRRRFLVRWTNKKITANHCVHQDASGFPERYSTDSWQQIDAGRLPAPVIQVSQNFILMLKPTKLEDVY